MHQKSREYIPALRYNWLTPLFDPLLHLVLHDSTFKQELIKQAGIENGQRVLDLGCGTASLTLLIKKAYMGAEVVGLDGDPKILEIARAKTTRADVNVMLIQGMSFSLPFPDNTFDRVLSSLLLHHLTRENKDRTLREVLRVLRPGGELHVVDWGKAQNKFMQLAFLLEQMLDGFETTADHVNGVLLELFRNAGFTAVQELTQYMTIVGTLSLYKAEKPQ